MSYEPIDIEAARNIYRDVTSNARILLPQALDEIECLRERIMVLEEDAHAYEETIAALEAGIIPPPELSALTERIKVLESTLHRVCRKTNIVSPAGM